MWKQEWDLSCTFTWFTGLDSSPNRFSTDINRLHLPQISRPKSSQFCRMEFEKSSQAKSWIFSVKSLAECKRIAVSMDSELEAGNRADTHCRMSNRVRKFASGFHKRGESGTTPLHLPTPSLRHQEILVQFHAHQIQFLIGPNAVLYELRTSEHVLSTAIMFFRRFYMSNAVVEISPRKIAAACAFFAAKVEEEKVEVRTSIRSSHGGSLCWWFCFYRVAQNFVGGLPKWICRNYFFSVFPHVARTFWFFWMSQRVVGASDPHNKKWIRPMVLTTADAVHNFC